MLEALSENELKNTFEEIQTQLPEKEGYSPPEWVINEIEEQLWVTIAGSDAKSQEYLMYNKMEISSPFLGYIQPNEEENNTGQLPWWLQSFDWKFESIGEPVVEAQNGASEVKQLRNFDSEETRVYRPEYNPNSDQRCIKKLLSGLNKIKIELAEATEIRRSGRTVYDSEEDHPKLPSKIFELSSVTSPESSVIKTSKEFEQWLTSILQLCPPYNETTTALTWYNLGLPREIGEQLLEKDIDAIEQAGLISDQNRIMNRSYRDAVSDIMSFQGVFDQTVNSDAPPELSLDEGIEAAYIGAWLHNTGQLESGEVEAIHLASKNTKYEDDRDNEMKYSYHCIGLPISYDGKKNYRLTFDTQSRIKSGKIGYEAEQRSRAKKIYEALKETSYFPDLDK